MKDGGSGGGRADGHGDALVVGLLTSDLRQLVSVLPPPPRVKYDECGERDEQTKR